MSTKKLDNKKPIEFNFKIEEDISNINFCEFCGLLLNFWHKGYRFTNIQFGVKQVFCESCVIKMNELLNDFKQKGKIKMKQEMKMPKEVADDLIGFLKTNWNLNVMNFWCPNDDETSVIVDGLLRNDATVYFTDLKSGYDFTDPKIWPTTWNGDFEMIITKPPFSLKDEFLERCIILGKPFALLMPDTLFRSKKRVKLLEKLKGDLTLLVPDKPNFKSIWVIGNICRNKIIFWHRKDENNI